MQLKIYTMGDNCECCKRLMAWLDARGINYQIVDVRQYE